MCPVVLRAGGALLALAACVLTTPAAAARPQPPQVELDRILSRVGGRIVTQSDVRQARTLELVDDTSSDDAVRRALEDRWLVLGEIARAAPVAPATDAELASRRADWLARRGAARGSGPAMSEEELQGWFRDDLRIRKFLERQFGALSPADRARAQEEWLVRLRARAELD